MYLFYRSPKSILSTTTLFNCKILMLHSYVWGSTNIPKSIILKLTFQNTDVCIKTNSHMSF